MIRAAVNGNRLIRVLEGAFVIVLVATLFWVRTQVDHVQRFERAFVCYVHQTRIRSDRFLVATIANPAATTAEKLAAKKNNDDLVTADEQAAAEFGAC